MDATLAGNGFAPPRPRGGRTRHGIAVPGRTRRGWPPSGQVEPQPPELQRDLGASARIRALVRSDLFATLLYAALCNTEWRHAATGARWSCSWRSAGGIVATLRAEGDYMDWYCSMGEGLVDEQVLGEIQALGWELVSAEPPE